MSMSFIERLLGLMSPPPKQQTGLVREKSDIITDQEDQGTCYAHTVSHMLSRLVKKHFKEHFESQKEKCSHLYRTKSCINIFKCLLEARDEFKSQLEAREEFKSQLDEYGWEKENISALLFTFIYRVVVNRFGCARGKIPNSLYYFFGYLNSNITLESVKDILNYNEDFFKHYLKTSLENEESEKILNYFEHLIGKLFTILIQFKEIYRSFGCQIYSIYPLNEDAKREEYSEKKRSQLIDNLKNSLDRGFYAILTYKPNNIDRSHAVTVIDFIENEDGFVLTVKNSWGPNRCQQMSIPFNKLADNPDFESFIYFMYPSIELPGGGRRRINKTIRKKRRKKSKRRLSRK